MSRACLKRDLVAMVQDTQFAIPSGILDGPHQHQHQNLEVNRILGAVGRGELGDWVPLGSLARVEEISRVEGCWKI